MSVKVWINKRKFVRTQVTKIFNDRETFSRTNKSDLDTLKSRLLKYEKELEDLNEKIVATCTDENFNYDEFYEACDSYNIKITSCLSDLNALVSKGSPLEGVITQLKGHSTPLPKFSGRDTEDLYKFINEFEQSTQRFNYSDYDKLILLKQQLSGRALNLVKSLESDKQTYVEAKKLLNDAFENKVIQTFNTVKQISQIKMPIDGDPYAYISEMRCMTEKVNRLNLTVDDFLRVFFWLGINENFQNQLVHITNNSKPTLAQINEHFFQACERYSSSSKVQKSNSSRLESNSTGLAAKVNYKEQIPTCSICSKLNNSNNDHKTSNCPKYPDSNSKINQIQLLKGCMICCQFNHPTENCRLRDTIRCFSCNGSHMTFLCCTNDKNDKVNAVNKPKVNDPNSSKKKAKSTEAKVGLTEISVSVSDAFCTNENDTTILPTFCGLLNGAKVRVLKDGGCQSNFISENLASKLNLTTVQDNLHLTVNGINYSRSYLTKSVKVNFTVGGKEHEIVALCLPSINVDLKLPGLSKVVNEFTNKGYNLADIDLLYSGDNITNIDFILGVNSAYVLPETDKLLSENSKCIYSETSAGVILKGDINELLNNLNNLDCIQTTGFLGYSHVSDDSSAELSDTNPDYNVLNSQGEIIESELERAAESILDKECNLYLNKEEYVDDSSVDLNNQLINYVLNNTVREENGRIRMPLLWNPQVSHYLGKNFNLSKAILKSLTKKLDHAKLKQIDEVFRNQENLGIIEKVPNVESFMQDHPESSFLPYMGIFRPDRDTTKVRIVFLSNLCEKDNTRPATVSHNQALYAGPSLNQKLSSSILHLRFDKYLLVFDIAKAFNNIVLNDIDSNRLLFLWYKNINESNFDLVLYRNVRLAFGLRCSPTILLLSLFKILLLDINEDSETLKDLKKLIYSLAYMDNLGISFNDKSQLKQGYDQLKGIFEPYGFKLQQFETNDQELQSHINSDIESEGASSDTVKLLGISWKKSSDVISTKPIDLNINASSKRQILSTIAAQFDLFQYNGPLLNRARLMLHDLQCDKELSWDETLSDELLKEWKNIAKQANSSTPIQINRSFGGRNDKYELIAFSDSSTKIYGCVLYLVNLDTKQINFVLARNKMVNKSLDEKSVPCLELQAIVLASETIIDVYNELCGDKCLIPINITKLKVFSDSLVTINWLNFYVVNIEKMQQKPVFVLNRLEKICRLSDIHPIEFSFIAGIENPADAITRPLSYKSLVKTNYINGPQFLVDHSSNTMSSEQFLKVVIPNPVFERKDVTVLAGSTSADEDPLIQVDRFSNYRKLVRVYRNVLVFVNKLKVRLKNKNPTKFGHLNSDDVNFYEKAFQNIVRIDQKINFPDVIDYFHSTNKSVNKIPDLIKQLNLYIDKFGIIRVKSKMERLKDINRFGRFNFPILLSRNSILANLIIRDTHETMFHAGIYTVLSELRKKFYITKCFSTVKRCLNSCIICKKFYKRPVSLNQSPYRELRLSPSVIPFRNVYLDYLGPFFVKLNGNKVKVWCLIITCMFTRAINLKLCLNQTTAEFLRSFQIHTYEYGIPETCISDLGSQLIAGANILKTCLNDIESKSYLEENGIKDFSFDHYFKGKSELGSLVETCVKLVKKLIISSIGKIILDYRDFEFLIIKTVHLVNKRPIAFKSALRQDSLDVPEPITPEKLIRGFSMPSLNLIPDAVHSSDPDWIPDFSTEKVRNEFSNIQTVRNRLLKLYNEEFLATLMEQSINRKDRYKPVSYENISPGDLVLLKEDFIKRYNYPMGRIKSVVRNDLNEVTGAIVIKGNKEVVKRHSSSLIPILTSDSDSEVDPNDDLVSIDHSANDNNIQRPKRQAAQISRKKTKQMLND